MGVDAGILSETRVLVLILLKRIERKLILVKIINGWIRFCDNFVKKLEDDVYAVIRIVDADEYTYYETYEKVRTQNVSTQTFSTYGSYDEYLEQKTLEEKAIYIATFGMTYDASYTIREDEEISSVLVDDGVIASNDIFVKS